MSYHPLDKFSRKKKHPNPNDVWTAPEHGKGAMSMERDWPRDHEGNRIPGKKKELVLDKRPTIMLPPKEAKPFGF
jgi:hypothetical protein